MDRVSSEVFATNIEQLQVQFTNTKRNEAADANSYSGYLLDIDGVLYQLTAQPRTTKQLVIVGGDRTTIGHTEPSVDGFYISNTQKFTLYKILKAISEYSDVVDITSDNEALQMLCTTAYRNYCG